MKFLLQNYENILISNRNNPTFFNIIRQKVHNYYGVSRYFGLSLQRR